MTEHMHPTQATTVCNQKTFAFQALGGRRVEADFSGGHLSSDGGSLLLREMDRRGRLCERLAGCFTDFRDAQFVEHELPVMLRQRILGLALGYEDINDHDRLRHDPLLAAVCGRADVLGEERHMEADRGRPLAGKSTLNRLELGAQEINARTKKIQAHPDRIEALLLVQGVADIPRRSGVIVLDFDATDDPLHGQQEGRFFHGYYGGYCYLPLYCFCGDIPLWAQLRTADRDGSDGTLPALEGTARTFAELRYRTLTSWSRERRVIGKAELIEGKSNPRYIVTDLGGEEEWARGEAAFADGASLYERFYCARGDMENRIKEQQMDMFADRTSTAFLSSNQLRLWFSTFAYQLLRGVRAVALGGTRLAAATVGTIRLQLLKIAAQVTVSVRRIYVRLCSACPMRDVFAHAHGRLRASSG